MIVYNEKKRTKSIRISESKLGLLKEGLSKKLFHFTDIDRACSILKNDKALLSMSTSSDEPIEGFSSKRMFFLSTTRTKSSQVGYQYGVFANINSMVRFELDGDKLLSDGYIGGPYNYFRNSGPSPKSVDINGDSFETQKHMADVESEDRVYSSKPYINHMYKYITRVDVYCPNYKANSSVLKEISICCDKHDLPCYIYEYIDDFNSMSDKTINGKIQNFEIEPNENKFDDSYTERDVAYVVNATMYYIGIGLKLMQGVDMTKDLFYDILEQFNLEEYGSYEEVTSSDYKPCNLETLFEYSSNINTHKYNINRQEPIDAMMLVKHMIINVFGVKSTKELIEKLKTHA